MHPQELVMTIALEVSQEPVARIAPGVVRS